MPGHQVFSCAPGWLARVSGQPDGACLIHIVPCQPGLAQQPACIALPASAPGCTLTPLGCGRVRDVRTGRRESYVVLIESHASGEARLCVGRLLAPGASDWAWRLDTTLALPAHPPGALSCHLIDGPAGVITTSDGSTLSLVAIAPTAPQSSTGIVACAIQEPHAPVPWRMGVLRWMGTAPTLLCVGRALCPDAPGPAALLRMPPGQAGGGWSFALVPLADAFLYGGEPASSEYTRHTASQQSRYENMGARVAPQELAEHAACACVVPHAANLDSGGLQSRGRGSTYGDEADVVLACTGYPVRVLLLRAGIVVADTMLEQGPADAGMQATSVDTVPGAPAVVITARSAWAVDDTQSAALLHLRSMTHSWLSQHCLHAIPLTHRPGGSSASVAIISGDGSGEDTADLSSSGALQIVDVCHAGAVLESSTSSSAHDPSALSKLADAVATRAAAAESESLAEERKLRTKWTLAHSASDMLRDGSAARASIPGLQVADLQAQFTSGEFLVSVDLRCDADFPGMCSASLLLLRDCGSILAVGRAVRVARLHTTAKLVCAAPSANIMAQPRGDSVTVVLTGTLLGGGDAADDSPALIQLARIVPDWSMSSGRDTSADTMWHATGVSQHIHIQSPPGGTDLRQLPALLRAALEIPGEVTHAVGAISSGNSITLAVPPGHAMLQSTSQATFTALTAHAGDLLVEAHTTSSAAMLHAYIAARMPPDVVRLPRAGADAALDIGCAMVDALLQELRCEDPKHLLRAQAATDAACARVLMTRP